MAEQIIVCPNCSTEIALSEAITAKIKDDLAKEFEKETRKQMEEEYSLKLTHLEEQLESKGRKLKDAQKLELELLKQKSELKEKEETIDLEIAKKLDKERATLREEAEKKVVESNRLEAKQKDKLIQDLTNQLDDLKRKAEQGSQQSQGEILELELEQALKDHFRFDLIEEVPKGIKGADIIQKVHTPSGNFCGTIVWESKRTKRWSDKWIPKLKKDQRSIKADLAIICSTALPKDTDNFTFIENVCVVGFPFAIPIAMMMRNQLMELANVKQTAIGKDQKMELLYQYLTGTEFRQRIEPVVEAFVNMKDDLEAEQRAMHRIWTKRDKQIMNAVYSLAGLYGDMQGIVGATLPEIESLNLVQLPEEKTE